MENSNKLPSVSLYSKYLNIASVKFNLTLDECRGRYGLFTNQQWQELLEEKMTIQQLAENIKSRMHTKKMTANQIIVAGVPKKKVYAVLQMGKNPPKHYTVQTLLEVLNAAKLELYEVAV